MKKNFRKLHIQELQRASIADYQEATKLPIVLVLDNIRSANNVGSIFRTADAFTIECIYLCGITAIPPNKDIHKTALGAELSVPWKHAESTREQIEKLQSQGYIIASIEQVEGSTLLQNVSIDTSKKYALVLGNEVHGVSSEIVEMSDICIEIPQFGTKHSFNVAVTNGIVLWEITKSLLTS